jgi:hypothetical protein
VITVFGGRDCVPTAVLVIPKTTVILVKQVIVRIIAGANESTVSNITIFKLDATAPPPASSLPPIEIERLGNAFS